MKVKDLNKTFILQQGQSDCGVACLLSLINYYEGTTTLEKLRELSGTNTQGTTLLGLYQAASKIGFNANGCEATTEALIDHSEPVILYVVMENRLQHYVVCYGYENNQFIIGDPAKGILKFTTEELEKIWIGRKCLTLTPTVNFIKSKKLKTVKKDWLIRLIKDDYSLLGVSLVLGIGIAVLGMVMAIFSQKLIDDILPSNDVKKLITGIGLVTVLLIVRVGLMAIRQFILLRQSKDFNNRIIHAFYSTLLYLPKSFFDTRKIGELVARLNDTGRIQRVITQVAGNIIIDGLMAFTSLTFLYVYSWQTGVIATISLPIYFLLIYRFNAKIIHAQKEVMSGYAHSESNYISTMQGVSVIKNFNKQELFAQINQLIYGNFQEKVFTLGKINIKLTLISGIAGVFFLINILSYITFQVYKNTLTVGELMAILGMASALLPAVANLALVAIPINEAKVAFDRMFEFVNILPENNQHSEKIRFESLTIENISFRFPGRKQILQNISLEIGKNEFIAIVGESGSGKSTLGQIIQQFYTPETGSVKVNNNVDFKNISTSWRTIIGVVPQDIHLFNGTVLDNICLSNTQEEVQKIVSFCQEYGFAPFIEQFPQSYFTILGEEGINLSGGQKQIIALARALYNNPQLLLLDEATAAMDRITEKFVLTLLSRLKSKMAVIFISHRLHILKNISDKIYVLEDGKIKAQGNHLELLASDNIYSEYWKEIERI
ncbi:MAG: peptidase domain-containing ABC transporter [Vicingaceae bacterium]|nr:peptidase domain-containing ABC transporter [Vicingaceae bacterium]